MISKNIYIYRKEKIIWGKSYSFLIPLDQLERVSKQKLGGV